MGHFSKCLIQGVPVWLAPVHMHSLSSGPPRPTLVPQSLINCSVDPRAQGLRGAEGPSEAGLHRSGSEQGICLLPLFPAIDTGISFPRQNKQVPGSCLTGTQGTGLACKEMESGTQWWQGAPAV